MSYRYCQFLIIIITIVNWYGTILIFLITYIVILCSTYILLVFLQRLYLIFSRPGILWVSRSVHSSICIELILKTWFCLRQFFILGLTKTPFGDYSSFLGGLLKKSKKKTVLFNPCRCSKRKNHHPLPRKVYRKQRPQRPPFEAQLPAI